MRFNPEDLPEIVKNFYKQGKIAWHATICAAIKAGIGDLNKLTDIAFHLHHPERKGRPIELHEVDLITQWNNFKILIKLMDSSKSFHDNLDGFVFKKGEDWINLISTPDIKRPLG